MNCPNCGFNLPDDAMFCGNCGTKIELVNNDNIVAGGEYNQPMNENNYVEPQPMQEAPQQYQQPEPNQQFQEDPNNGYSAEGYVAPEEESKKKSKLPIIIVATLGGILLIAIIVLALNFLGGTSGSSDERVDSDKAPAFYEEDGDLYIIYPGDTEGTEFIEDFEGQTSNLVAIDEDTFYYIEDEALFYKDGKKDPEELYDDVISMTISESGEKALIINEDSELLYYNGKDVVEICDEYVYSYYLVFSDDEKSFGFVYYDDKKYTDVLCYSNGEEEEYEEVDIDEDDYAYESLVGISKDYIYYTVYDYEEYNSILFKAEKDGDSEEITEDNVYDSQYIEKDTLVYIADDDFYYYDGDDSSKIAKNIYYMYNISAEGENIIGLSDDDDNFLIWKPGFEEALEVEDSDDALDMDYTSELEKILFSTEDELVLTEFNGKKLSDQKTYEIEDIYEISIMEDGKIAILLDDKDTLYIYKIGDDEAEEVLDDVHTYRVSDNNKIVAVNDDYEVYYYAGKEAEEVGEDYDSYLRILDNGKAYCYIDDKDDFYFGKGGKEAEEIEGDITSIRQMGSKYIYLINDDNEALLYKVGSDEAEETDIEVDDWYSIYWFLY